MGGHDVLMSIDINSIAILNIHGVNYCCKNRIIKKNFINCCAKTKKEFVQTCANWLVNIPVYKKSTPSMCYFKIYYFKKVKLIYKASGTDFKST